ncbi:MAG: CRISPR-associated endonuclease Cas2 [bacterium]
MKKNCIIVTYDIQDDKLRRHVSEFLVKYGVRLQFSVFEIVNSPRVIGILCEGIKRKFQPRFTEADSIIMFFTDLDKAITYGNAKHLNKEVVFIG